MDKDIEILENKIQVFRYMQSTLDEDEKELYVEDFGEEEIQAIENLIKRNKELEEHLQEFYNAELFTANQAKLIEKEYIPKSKIKKDMSN